MKSKHKILSTITFITILSLSMTGCTFIFQKGRRTDVEKITTLKDKLSDMERAKKELEDQLRKEIADKEVKVEMLEKGLVITFVAEVLFDSGKADLREESFEGLNKVANVIQTTVKGYNIGVEGHTDNVPITYSKWADNWELSSERALSVLRYLINKEGVAPERLSATGYGEFKSVDTNDTPEGRQKNRRVEVVILPQVTKEGR